MRHLSPEILSLRSDFIFAIRSFFSKNSFIEIDTPILKKTPGMEPYLDPIKASSPHKDIEGYLITSPEYSLKQVLSLGKEKIYEITHAFRSGEKGSLHTTEFLMLEFYQIGIDEKQLIEVCIELFDYLQNNFKNFNFNRNNCKKVSMEELFFQHVKRGFQRNELIQIISENNLPCCFDKKTCDYEDLFFLVFLNLIEPELPEEIFFIYDYPKEMAALAKISGQIANRFEIYYGRVELGNAFYELTSPDEQEKRFKLEQQKRADLKKEVFNIDEEFMNALKSGIADVSGISIGLDRLLMVLLGHSNLQFISPYYRASCSF